MKKKNNPIKLARRQRNQQCHFEFYGLYLYQYIFYVSTMSIANAIWPPSENEQHSCRPSSKDNHKENLSPEICGPCETNFSEQWLPKWDQCGPKTAVKMVVFWSGSSQCASRIFLIGIGWQKGYWSLGMLWSSYKFPYSKLRFFDILFSFDKNWITEYTFCIKFCI